MATAVVHETGTTRRPDHTQLPCNDGVPVRNSLEPYQSALLTVSLKPVLDRLHPESDYFIGQDNGIYWRETNPTDRGVKSPDWYLVRGVPRLLASELRRSYVLWQELIAPVLVLEYVSGEGVEERDRTPWTGMFWVYENVIHAAYYGIYEPEKATVEMYQLVAGHYQQLSANAQGRHALPELGVELGLWPGSYGGYELPWMRWWDSQGNLLLTGEERAELAMREVERLTAQLRSLGVNPEPS